MFEELIQSLRNCVADDKGCCFRCPEDCNGPCQENLMTEAADAIEELSGKATFKRVDFTEWKGTRYTRYGCPYCHKYVRNDETYCHKCGQALMFPKISFTPYVPGEKQAVIVTWPDEP